MERTFQKLAAMLCMAVLLVICLISVTAKAESAEAATPSMASSYELTVEEPVFYTLT